MSTKLEDQSTVNKMPGADLPLLHSAAVCSTVDFVFYRLLLDVLNSPASQRFTNKPAKNNGLSKQQQSPNSQCISLFCPTTGDKKTPS